MEAGLWRHAIWHAQRHCRCAMSWCVALCHQYEPANLTWLRRACPKHMPACGYFLCFDSWDVAALVTAGVLLRLLLGYSVLLQWGRQPSCSWNARGWKSSKVFLGTDMEDNFAAAHLAAAAESDASIASLLWSSRIGDAYHKRPFGLNAAIGQGLRVSLHLGGLEPSRAAARLLQCSCTLIGLGELFWSSPSSRMACHQHLSDAAA